MRVYADIFFLLNAGADWALLLAAGWLTGTSAAPGRLLAAAALGGLYALGALLLPFPAAFSGPGAAAAGALMVAAAYAPRPARTLLRLLLCLYGAAALAVGIALLAGLGAAGAGLPWWGVLAALGGTLATAAAVWDRRRAAPPEQMWHSLEVAVGDRRARCRALLDTGNRLRDPYGDGPAIIVAASLLDGLLPPSLARALRCGPEALALALQAPGLPPHWSRRFRLLPYRAVGQAGGILPALRPDAAWLGTGRQRRAVRAVLAVSPTPLDPDGGFAALLPPGLLSPEPAPAARGLPLAALGDVSEGGAAK